MRIPTSQWEIALDDIGIGSAQVDSDGKWQTVNPRLLELLGYSSEEIVGDPFDKVFEVSQPEREAKDRRTTGMKTGYLRPTAIAG